jgi:iron complex outermembrane receptor protein
MKRISSLSFPGRRLLAAAMGLLISCSATYAQSSGAIEGRVVNSASGDFLGKVQITIAGTTVEAFTNPAGEYRLSNVPAGSAGVTAYYSGFRRVTTTVTVGAGQTAHQDFSLELAGDDRPDGIDKVTQLDHFTVTAQKLSSEALAINEQRVAANIKNVVSLDEFGNMGEGNPGEFLKYVPGLSVTFGPAIATGVSVRGVPANGTLVMEEGNPIASSSGDRAFELTGAATGNIERIEVTKSPTPDMPANAIGGTVNIIGKSGFARTAPQLNYSVFYTFNWQKNWANTDTITFKKRPSPAATSRPILPGIDLTYILPVNRTFALTFSASASKRYYDADYDTSVWNLVTNINERYVKNDTIQLYDKKLASITADWRMTKSDTLRAKFQYSSETSYTSQNSLDYRFGTLATGDAATTTSRAAAGSIFATSGNFIIPRITVSSALHYAHEGAVWKIEGDGSYSRSGRDRRDMEEGVFNTYTASYATLNLAATGMNRLTEGVVPRITATKAGAPVDVFDGAGMPITAASSTTQDIRASSQGGRLSVSRSFDPGFPLTVKVGGSWYQDALDSHLQTAGYTMTIPGPAGSNTGRALGLISDGFNKSVNWRFADDGSRVPAQWISAAKLYDLYVSNPSYFAPSDSAFYISRITGSKEFTESITAGYIRFDAKLINNRLRVTTGVRYERTEDNGAGPLNNISATYQHDANGNIVRDSAGKPVKVSTDALALAKLQYTERGARSSRDYDGYYPSINAAYTIKENIITRASYARTIGRPALTFITPGTTITDPTSSTVDRTITIANTGLKPWNADNYDLTIEIYNLKGAVFSAGVFRKDITNFFAVTTTPATSAMLADLGLSDEFLGYDIATNQNFGSASVTGFEWSYRQALFFLPKWAHGFQIFANGTHLSLSGPNAEDLTGFSHQNINWGISFVRPRLLAKVNVSMSGDVKLARVAPSVSVPVDTFRYIAPQTLVDVSLEYRFSRKLSAFASVRNALQDDKRTNIASATTPSYASSSVVQRTGSLVTIGLKGQF